MPARLVQIGIGGKHLQAEVALGCRFRPGTHPSFPEAEYLLDFRLVRIPCGGEPLQQAGDVRAVGAADEFRGSHQLAEGGHGLALRGALRHPAAAQPPLLRVFGESSQFGGAEIAGPYGLHHAILRSEIWRALRDVFRPRQRGEIVRPAVCRHRVDASLRPRGERCAVRPWASALLLAVVIGADGRSCP